MARPRSANERGPENESSITPVTDRCHRGVDVVFIIDRQFLRQWKFRFGIRIELRECHGVAFGGELGWLSLLGELASLRFFGHRGELQFE